MILKIGDVNKYYYISSQIIVIGWVYYLKESMKVLCWLRRRETNIEDDHIQLFKLQLPFLATGFVLSVFFPKFGAISLPWLIYQPSGLNQWRSKVSDTNVSVYLPNRRSPLMFNLLFQEHEFEIVDKQRGVLDMTWVQSSFSYPNNKRNRSNNLIETNNKMWPDFANFLFGRIRRWVLLTTFVQHDVVADIWWPPTNCL